MKVNFKYVASRRAAAGVLKAASPFAPTGDAAPDTVVATTVLYYDDPSEAGRESWPAVVVKENHIPGANGFVKAGDYTQMVKDIYPGVSASSPSDLTDVNGFLFFVAQDGHGRELYRSDGTQAGTRLVCQYPQVALYKGSGAVEDSASYSCK